MLAALLTVAAHAQDAVPGFLPPVAGVHATPFFAPLAAAAVTDAATCGAACAAASDAVVSMNVCGGGAPNATTCHCSSWNVSYTLLNQTDCQYYRRSIPRNDTRVAPVLRLLSSPPMGGVALGAGGVLGAAFAANVAYLGLRADVDSMLYRFRLRPGGACYNATPPGHCFGWDCSLAPDYSLAGFVMGAAASLRWAPAAAAALAPPLDAVLAGMAACADAGDGWFLPWEAADMNQNWYSTSGLNVITEALLEAAGVATVLPPAAALKLLRDAHDVYTNHSSLPTFLPPNGGPSPVLPYPPGFNNETDGGTGQGRSHNIYFTYTAALHNTLTALSPVGTQADVDIVANLIAEPWWLEALQARDPFWGVWHRVFHQHNYMLRALCAFVDMAVLTGVQSYMDAALGGWAMLRDSWIHVGGSVAINEISYYPPKSYFLDYTAAPPPAAGSRHHSHDHAVAAGPETAASDASTTNRRPGASGEAQPTGELCGSAFYVQLNARLQQLDPENDTFAAEIERSVLNVAAAAIDGSHNGAAPSGIRYFANMHSQKQVPTVQATCCENHGTHLLGALPQHLFSLAPPPAAAAAAGGAVAAVPASTVYVHLYATATLALTAAGVDGAPVAVSLAVATAWPLDAAVTVTLASPRPLGALDVALRIPAWVAAPAVPVAVNGSTWPAAGAPGSYLHIALAAWPAGATALTLSLPMALTAHAYGGLTQLPPFTRYAFTVGPVLLAAQAPVWNASFGVLVPAVDGAQPGAWLRPVPGAPLHYAAEGGSGVTMKPYYAVAPGEAFTTYACFDR